MKEKWLPIKGFEGFYEISDMGNVRRTKSKRIRAVSQTSLYSHILLSKNGIHTTRRVHRLVAEAFLTMIPGKTHVNHKNGDKRDNRLENLEWVTQAENNLHAYRVLKRKPALIGRIPPNAKVKQQDVLLYDRLNKQGISTEKIGEMYGVCGSTVRKHLRDLRNDKNNKQR